MNHIDQVYHNVNLKEGKGLLRQFLLELYIHQSLSNKILAGKLLLPIPVVTAIKKEFMKLDLVMQSGGIRLTPKGILYVEKELGYAGLNVELYTGLLGDDAYKASYIAGLAAEISPLYEARPQVDVVLDQALCTPETAVKRAVLCLENGMLIGKKVLCIGDDDLISVALGFLLRDLFPGKRNKAEIVVFDVDERLTGYIMATASEHGFPIECQLLNLRDPLPLRFLNTFDCFFTDPPYTIDGMTLFLSRGISALKKEKGNKVFLSFGQKPIEDTYQLQRTILEHGLIVKRIINSFNRYEGASLLGNESQMLVLESTTALNTVIAAQTHFGEPIYTREVNFVEREYSCKQCRHRVFMSTREKTQFKTIEQLKEQGCPKCGHQSFDLITKKQAAKAQEDKKFLGTHIIADFFDCDQQILKSRTCINDLMDEAARGAKASIVSKDFHVFNPWGVSGAIIIKESHFTIHTWPEYHYAAVDLFTCGDSLDLLAALEFLKAGLKSGKMEYSYLARGIFQNNKIASSAAIEKSLE